MSKVIKADSIAAPTPAEGSVLFSAPVARAARLLQVAVLFLVPFGALLGRPIERALPRHAPLLPIAGALVFLVATALLLRLLFRTERARGRLLRRLATTRAGIMLLLVPMILIFLLEQLIVAPIERIHFVKYGLLAASTFFCTRRSVAGRALVGFACAALVGSLEEFSQLYIPSRIFDPRDLLLNGVGALFGTSYALCLVFAEPREVLSLSEPQDAVVSSK